MAVDPLAPRRSDSRRNRDRVLEAAIEVLSDDPSATVEDVAAAAGLTRSTVYRRFRSRDALLAAVRDRLVEETRGVFRDAVAREPDFARCMDEMIREAVRNSFERRRAWQRLTELGSIPRVEEYQPQDAFMAWLEAGQRDGNLRADVPRRVAGHGLDAARRGGGDRVRPRRDGRRGVGPSRRGGRRARARTGRGQRPGRLSRPGRAPYGRGVARVGAGPVTGEFAVR